MSFSTPLRYPGGKGKLTDFIKLVFIENDLINGHYIEPYAGGSGIALNLLMDGYVSCIHINDLNKAVFAFWHSVLNDPDALCRRIRDTQVCMDEWHQQKSVIKKPNNHSLLDLGFATFFLNRTNRSGIISAGVIGGKHQTGTWKIDARFNKEDLIQRIEKIALRRSYINLYNLDAVDLINSVLPELPKKSLVYLDPPYYVKGKDLYEDHYRHDDHERIAALVKEKISLPWIVSYDHAPEIMSIYEDCQSITYGINYSANNKYKGAEAMFFSKKLSIPNIKNPIKPLAA